MSESDAGINLTGKIVDKASLYMEYIKSNKLYYKSAFMSMARGVRKFNGSAFLFTSFWLLYRRMPGYAFALAGIQCLMVIAREYFPSFSYLGLLAISIAFGMFANTLYMKKSIK